MSPADFDSLLVRVAKEHGFPLAGALDIGRVSLEREVTHYDRWVADGHAAAMQYLVRGRDRRADIRLVFPEARSVLCVAWPYSSRPGGQADPARGARYSRYLRSRDYHKEVADRLESAMRAVAAECGDPELRWKVCVDTSAVLERAWAALAGLGWIGKNSMLIHPQLGSYLFLAEVLINRETGQGPRPLPEYCGNCTRCLDACPTGAFKAPRTLDSGRCIAYLTLEKRGPLDIDESLKRGMGSWIAGCDICQEICPFNTKAAKSPVELPDQAISVSDWKDLLEESEEKYRERIRDSSLSRVKPAQFRRNLAIALANAFVLADAEGRDALSALAPHILARKVSESDPDAAAEWDRCLHLYSQPQ